MAVQQLTQPIVNPIVAFDATRAHTINFTVIGGAQVVGNRLVISDNETGTEIYNNKQLTMKLEHTVPAGTLSNGGYYNAVIYTVDNSGAESVASTAVPFYCYSQPVLTIDNIPQTETIENGTYAFVGSYLQQEDEPLNSYQYTLYNSNKEVLSQSALIYYEADSSLSYTFVGMSNDTAYYISLTGETVNGTKITSGLRYFTVRYLQPASFAICDLVNNCEDGYIQISSNIVAIDGKSNPDPPVYIDDKEVDLREPNTWVRWDEGFRIQNDFTMRVWGRDFNPYEKIITLTNDINTTATPNKIELKWMLADVIKELPTYVSAKGLNVNLTDSKVGDIQNLTISGNSEQETSEIYSVGDIKNLISVSDFNITYKQGYSQETNTQFLLKPNYIYTLSFDYNVNDTTTDIYYSVGYGINSYEADIQLRIQYKTLTNGRNSVSFTVPGTIPEGSYLWVKFAQTIILADINVDVSKIQLESGNKSTDYQSPTLYNIYPTSASKNLYDYDSPIYIIKNNIIYSSIQNGYNIVPQNSTEDCDLAIGYRNLLVPGNTYAISFNQLGNFKYFKLYTTDKNSQEQKQEIEINNGIFVAPDGFYDLQLVFAVDNSLLSNSLEIWNIQIETNNIITEYENHVSNSSIITLDEPLRGFGDRKDLICLESPNVLNHKTLSGTVTGNTTYYLNQKGDTEYHIWYYNNEGNLIKFIDEEGHEASGVVGIRGSFTTHKECVKITITKSTDPDVVDITSGELLNNEVIISKGNEVQAYYPYVSAPSLIRYCKEENDTISLLDTPVVYDLSIDNQNALKVLKTYSPISNVFTNNKLLGNMSLDYINNYAEQETKNAYVLLKCWNANSMPYVIHSNYIDIPEDTSKVFIWMRRKNNLFDLQIEDLGDYNEDDKPIDTDKPVVALDIDLNNVTQTTIPVTATAIDETGLRTMRFSKDNGTSWDEVIPIDGLSSSNSYTFENLNPDTTYTIRVEAIDLSGNIGGISQQVKTKS